MLLFPALRAGLEDFRTLGTSTTRLARTAWTCCVSRAGLIMCSYRPSACRSLCWSSSEQSSNWRQTSWSNRTSPTPSFVPLRSSRVSLGRSTWSRTAAHTSCSGMERSARRTQSVRRISQLFWRIASPTNLAGTKCFRSEDLASPLRPWSSPRSCSSCSILSPSTSKFLWLYLMLSSRSWMGSPSSSPASRTRLSLPASDATTRQKTW
mmetsp:Transcript_2344/g.5506  ORF Transcript_2344/g.5506 Transcript_2344/m.5506 type:complete len:208 (+) Transcript_2344:524-1147(+)